MKGKKIRQILGKGEREKITRQEIEASLEKKGYQNYQGLGLLLKARVETALAKGWVLRDDQEDFYMYNSRNPNPSWVNDFLNGYVEPKDTKKPITVEEIFKGL